MCELEEHWGVIYKKKETNEWGNKEKRIKNAAAAAFCLWFFLFECCDEYHEADPESHGDHLRQRLSERLMR